MIIIPDLINGAFEAFGGVFIVINIHQLLKDKIVKGIHWGSTIFFTIWGIWNVYYYPFLGQWISFSGGLFIAVANIIWMCLRVYYWRKRLNSSR
jgi:hypothetical protein